MFLSILTIKCGALPSIGRTKRERLRMSFEAARDSHYFLAMADTRTKEQRSRIMKSVRTKDTGPELVVRKLLHSLGFRFRLHRKDLPGKPDITLARHRTVVFVHGCFWHGHDCKMGNPPKSKLDYWRRKLDSNKARDERNTAALRDDGWNVVTVWQCELKDVAQLARRLTADIKAPKNDRLNDPS